MSEQFHTTKYMLVKLVSKYKSEYMYTRNRHEIYDYDCAELIYDQDNFPLKINSWFVKKRYFESWLT